MSVASQPLGRRERNKQEKLERITAAASKLFAKYGVDEVTTQQIADAADIGTGTLFLYAKNKGELLLLVQNLHYAQSLERGLAAANKTSTALDGILAFIEPIVECNRVQVENGRTYLREMVFGDPEEPHHAEALAIVEQTQAATANLLVERSHMPQDQAKSFASVISSIMFLELSATVNAQSSNSEIMGRLRTQISSILPS
ncbi:TetR/AcrR family transcriptional regulator [Arthrobacter sp. S41]|uniref:TetR/AcrR family transcriptional regulator n=1 Tax=Arthrobacter sp. S41 TaxID=2509721 RepID=UPI0010366C98|nr:TetR/AcrR family transcriptional regulator [Arthrobacter sp. S41]TAP28195.1 TetR/AcrR family transcriptional regulator [Arthrobacter sp. S41]